MTEPEPRVRGQQPDYRYSLANERTFLAWIRTALALLAAGIGVIDLPTHFASRGGRQAIGIGLVVLGIGAAGASFRRWRSNEAAMSAGTPLPAPRMMPAVAVGLTAIGTAALVLVLLDVG